MLGAASARVWVTVGCACTMLMWLGGCAARASPSGRPVRATTASATPSLSLVAVSCSSSSACMAIGSVTAGSKEESVAERWNGSSWSAQLIPTPPHPALLRVSCPSLTCALPWAMPPRTLPMATSNTSSRWWSAGLGGVGLGRARRRYPSRSSTTFRAPPRRRARQPVGSVCQATTASGRWRSAGMARAGQFSVHLHGRTSCRVHRARAVSPSESATGGPRWPSVGTVLAGPDSASLCQTSMTSLSPTCRARR